MNILFYRYDSICEPDVIEAFQALGVDVKEETAEIAKKDLSQADRVTLVSRGIETFHPLFVFSINFFPALAEVCHIYRVPYVCWTVDSPVPELFSTSILHDTNRIFLFDGAQYEKFHPFHPECIFHLPLGANTDRFDRVCSTITHKDRQKFEGDISFVGSLYSEKNPLHCKESLSEYTKGYIQGLVEASLRVYGCNLIEETLPQSVIAEIKEAYPGFYHLPSAVADMDRYLAAHSYIGMEVAEVERTRTLNTLAQYYNVKLFTGSDCSRLQKVQVYGRVRTHTEMPKVFRLSKINLNMTIRPIQTGLPLRVFDILGCGGFLMTNYQAELTDCFTIGVDLEAYSSAEELIDKCGYYLTHDTERAAIARNGYEKVKKMHGYRTRLAEMIRTLQ